MKLFMNKVSIEAILPKEFSKANFRKGWEGQIALIWVQELFLFSP